MMSSEKNEVIQKIEKSLAQFNNSLTISERSAFSAEISHGKRFNGLSENIQKKLKNQFSGQELELQQNIIENKNALPEYLRMQLAVVINNLKVEHPATLSLDSRNTLNQRLNGGHSESSKLLSIPSADINESLNKISNLIRIYETNNVYQNQIDLLREIENFMTMADLKILNNLHKSDTELKLQPNVIKDSENMLAQMKTLSLYGQELSGDKDFGKENIANLNNALENATNKLSILSEKIKTVDEIDQLITQFESEKEISSPSSPKEDTLIEEISAKGLDFGMEDLDKLQTLIDDQNQDNKENQIIQNKKIELEFNRLSNKYSRYQNTQDELKISHANIGEKALENNLSQISNLLKETEETLKNTGKNEILIVKITELKNNLEKTKGLLERKLIRMNPPSESLPLPPALSDTEEDINKNSFEEIASEMENIKKEKPLDINIVKPESTTNLSDFVSEKSASAHSKLNTTLSTLYQNNRPQIESSNRILNNYHYDEYHYTEDLKTDTVGTNNKLEVRVYNNNSYNGPRTEDFIRRAESLHQAAVSMISPENSEREKIINHLNALLENTKQTLQEKAAIDPQKMRASNGPEYFAEKHGAALDILQEHIINSLDTINDGQKHDLGTMLINLETAESEVVAKAGRANLLHVYDVAGHTRVSLSETQGDHTNPSTMRDKPELSNFVKVSSGYLDKDGTTKIEFSAYRHSSYPPIKILGSDIEDKMKRRAGAAQSVEQMIKTLAQDMLAKNPDLLDASKQPIEIKLSSMMLLTPLLKDQTFMNGESEMRQLKDSLIALNIYNNQEIKLNINGQDITVKPVLTQMNIPANNVMKVQFKKLGGEFNDNINNKGFYEYNKNFLAFIKTSEKSDATFQNIIQPLAYMYKKDEKLHTLEKQLEDLQQKSNITKLYSELGKLQNDATKSVDYKAKLTEIRAAEKQLNAVYTNIIARQKALLKDNQSIINNIRNTIESELIKNPDNKSLQVAQLYLDSSKIYFSDAHKKSEHGHHFQTRYLLANYLMGNNVEFFCKSGEDRTGRANNHLEEFLAFRRENGFFPRFNNIQDLEKLKPIARRVQTGSVSTEITNQNAPGAKGLQQDSSFGSNKHLQLSEFDLKNAQMAKGVYNISLLKKIKHKIQMQLTKTDFEKEFNTITHQFQNLMTEKLSLNSDVAKQKIDDKQTATPTLKNTALLKLEEKANQLFAELNVNTRSLSDITLSAGNKAKALSDICSEIRVLKTKNIDSSLHQEINQIEANIKSQLHTLTAKVTDHINEETGRQANTTTTLALSGVPLRSLQKSPSLVQNDIMQTIKPVFKAPEFTMKPDNNQSVIVKKLDEEKPFITVSNKEIQSYSLRNTVDDYKLMIQAAARMFDKPLLIYMPEAEKSKFDKAIDELIHDPQSGLEDKHFERTTNRQDYETRLIKAQAAGPKQAPISAAAPKEEDIHGLH